MVLGTTLALVLASVQPSNKHCEPRTEAAVLAADDDWLAAERRGDVNALSARLADGYRDVEPDGKVNDKVQLLRWTAERKDKASGSVAEVAATFRKLHPMDLRVAIFGDTAIVSFHSLDPNAAALVKSVDVFSYVDGMWKGVLSKHSS